MPGPKPRPQLIPADDFARLCQMAWADDPRRSLAKQVSLAKDVSEFTVNRWFDGAQTPPPAIVAEALERADKRMAENADLLDRVAQALKQNPGA